MDAAELAQDARDAGQRFLRVQVRNGVRTLTHPMKMKVSDLSLHLVVFCFHRIGWNLISTWFIPGFVAWDFLEKWFQLGTTNVAAT